MPELSRLLEVLRQISDTRRIVAIIQVRTPDEFAVVDPVRGNTLFAGALLDFEALYAAWRH